MSWGYCSHNGPHTWINVAEAAKGQKQSPIDLDSFEVKYDSNLSDNSLKINYGESKPKDFINTGHSIQMTFTQDGPSLAGGPLTDDFAVAQFHFHWGMSSDCGSEHTVNGKTYAAECHIVHFNKTKYATIAEAVDKPDGLCVLGMFIKVGKEHESMKKMISSLDQVKNKKDSIAWTSKFDPSSLLPLNISNYWTYSGSLTTPPCFESVTWIVFEEPIEFSEEQLSKMRSLCSCEKGQDIPNDELGGKMGNNYRPPQPVHGRIVRASFEN